MSNDIDEADELEGGELGSELEQGSTFSDMMSDEGASEGGPFASASSSGGGSGPSTASSVTMSTADLERLVETSQARMGKWLLQEQETA